MWYPGWDSGTEKTKGNLNKPCTLVNNKLILVH